MKNMIKFLTAAAALTAVTSMAAPISPFKSYTYPHGNVIKYGDDAMIKEHFNKWKKAWMKDVNGETWVLAPEGDCSTVSEGIAYGMLIMVYMDDGTNGAEQDFAKLYKTWSNHGGGTKGMDWRINNGNCPDQQAGTGSASDADFDAALALAMAGKQWNNAEYTQAAKDLATWIASNDIDGNNSVKPGNQWNDAFNPSYATLANFRVFKGIGASGSWDAIATKAAGDLSACQNNSTGLVPDWCDWSSHQPVITKASVNQNALGLYDDAARTYWRTAWDYYWYGTASSKSFNAVLTKWLYKETNGMASAIRGGYSLSGKVADSRKDFTSSTFSGGLGLAAASDETEEGAKFLQSAYNYLASKTSCTQAANCGETGGPTGEKYFPATLNILYLLLMTGHMPNLVDMTGFEEFVPDPSSAPGLSASDGQQMQMHDSTIGISGFWNWGAYHDDFDIGTKMVPDTGSPLFYKADLDQIVAEVSMTLGQEPQYVEGVELNYPSAGVAMSFLADESQGVDLAALGVKALRITAKVSGPVRLATLSTKTHTDGAEPGVVLEASADYAPQTIDLTPDEYGFVGFRKANNDFGGLLDWVWQQRSEAPLGEEILKTCKGLKFEVKGSGDIGDISIKAVEFLDGSGNVIDPVLITGMEGVSSKPAIAEVPASSSSELPVDGSSSSALDPIVAGSSSSYIPGEAIPVMVNVAKFKANVAGLVLQISNATAGSDFAVFSMQGKVITSGKMLGSSRSVVLPNKGAYVVRVGSEIRTISVK